MPATTTTTTTTQPPDLTGPTITSAGANPTQIWETSPGLCAGKLKQLTISATASDPSGVASITAAWTVGGTNELKTMSGGSTRTTTFGPYPYPTVADQPPYANAVTVTIAATDTLGNKSTTEIVVTLTGAGDCFG